MPLLPFRLLDRATYPCPVCRRGEIQPLPLMEACGCNFCQHIFTVNLETEVLCMADREPPLSWHWDGRQWTGAHLAGVEFNWIYGVAAIAFLGLPTGIVGLGAYLFPPIPGSPLDWVPTFWVSLVFMTHLVILLWLVGEFYQFPVGAYLQALRRALDRHYLQRYRQRS